MKTRLGGGSAATAERLLAVTCPACAAANSPRARFCGDCGRSTCGDGASRTLGLQPHATSAASPAATAIPSRTELRHVSVLFCDLVGFTPLSEKRDPEEVRELLSGYFEPRPGDRRALRRRCREVHRRRGDGGMGSPGGDGGRCRARGASRARARSRCRLGRETSATGAPARVGVVTGEAATTETQRRRGSSSATA